MRVILADDASMIRQGLARLLGEAGVDVVAQVGDGESLVAEVGRHRPDVAVVDIRMPPPSRSRGSSQLGRCAPTTPRWPS